MKRIVLIWMACGLCGSAFGETDATESKLPPEIQKPMAAVKAAVAKAEADPARPVFHFHPPAQWMNDLNGPIWYKDYYHIFYQHNPYGDQWGNMHWGHARSRDLVQWEHLPIALWPSKEKGEDHCFSGCAAIDGSGRPILIYTSIGDKRAPEIWAAVPEDDELFVWKKHPANPILTLADHGGQQIDDWRDPFVFKAEGKNFMVVGGHPKGGKGAIFVYEARNAELTQWTYRGIGFEGTEGNWECPNLFPLQGKWVLVYSPHGTVRYYVGQFDAKTCKFTPQSQGTMDYGDYYAPNCLEDPQGRRIMWGWVRGFPVGKGWNGCLTLPRMLSLDPQGQLVQTPVDGLKQLRGRGIRIEERQISDSRWIVPDFAGDCLEAVLRFRPGQKGQFGLAVRCAADGSKGIPIVIDAESGKLSVGNKIAEKGIEPDSVQTLHVFLDNSVLEVYAVNGRVCITAVIQADPADQNISLVAEEGTMSLEALQVWPIR
ncbi:MAG: glycoside hydrolase family 32 protein [Phycisphaerae bacterium]|nr:glycoside hydrolase family 32 protein [Phycisphaerae bacterium]